MSVIDQGVNVAALTLAVNAALPPFVPALAGLLGISAAVAIVRAILRSFRKVGW